MTSIGYLVFYVLGMIPTYILPYFGSNSYVATGVGAALSAASGGVVQSPFGGAFTILHIGALTVCIVIAGARGKTNGKSWLVALPIVATLFDLAPVLNVIPLVPTVLHVIALVVGFAESAIPVPDDKIPDSRLILLALVGIIGTSFIGAGASTGYATYQISQAAKRAAEKAEKERQAAEEVRKQREAAEAKKRADEAEARARKQQEVDEAVAKFREIETKERAAFDERETQLQAYTNVEIQNRMTKFASALNKGDTSGAAAIIGVSPTLVYSAAQEAINSGGFAEVKLQGMNARPGAFKFNLKPTYRPEGTPPTEYDIESKSTVIEANIKIVGNRAQGPFAKDPKLGTCVTFKYTVAMSGDNGKPIAEMGSVSVDKYCNKAY